MTRAPIRRKTACTRRGYARNDAVLLLRVGNASTRVARRTGSRGVTIGLLTGPRVRVFERDPRRQCNNMVCVCVYGHDEMRRFGRDADRVDGRGGGGGAERGVGRCRVLARMPPPPPPGEGLLRQPGVRAT